MTDRPILFSGTMVRALLENRKSQTRRLAWRDCRPRESGVRERLPAVWQKATPGDRLWVKETYGSLNADHPRAVGGRKPQPGDRLVYRANPADDWQWRRGPQSRADFVWRPSIHMFRWASRLTLVVTDVRTQRLQEISHNDVTEEGASNAVDSENWWPRRWDCLHGAGAWDENPEVVALTFTVHQMNIDAMEEVP